MAKNLKEVVSQLKGAVVAHGKQAKAIEKHIKEMKDGPSMFGKLRERQQNRKENMQKAKDVRQNTLIPQPNSNGTGSARPNFNPFAQNAIGGVMGGQQMGDMLFGQQPPQAPNTPPVDPMNPDPVDTQSMNEKMMGMAMAAKPKQIAKAQAKEYANKKGLRGKARKELIKDAKRSQSFDAGAQDEKSGDKPVNFGA